MLMLQNYLHLFQGIHWVFNSTEYNNFEQSETFYNWKRLRYRRCSSGKLIQLSQEKMVPEILLLKLMVFLQEIHLFLQFSRIGLLWTK
jgi:hypothetical protein